MDIKDSKKLNLILSVLYMKVMRVYKSTNSISYRKIFDSLKDNDKYNQIEYTVTRQEYGILNDFLYKKNYEIQPQNKIVTRLLKVMLVGSHDSFLQYHIIRSNSFKIDILKINNQELIRGQMPWMEGSEKSDEIYDHLVKKTENIHEDTHDDVINKIIDEAVYRFDERRDIIKSSALLNSVNHGGRQKKKEKLKSLAEDFTMVNIYWGTNRASEDTPVGFVFNDKRNNNSEEQLRVGISSITIPKKHKVGALERPNRWLGIFKRKQGNINKHIMIHSSLIMRKPDWVSAFMSESNENEGLLFIHGYNCSFDDALYRAAQLKYDLKFTGPTFSFNWASRGNVMGYSADEDTIRWSKHHLEEMLNVISADNRIKKLHIVAHSMGNRALIDLVEKWPKGIDKVHTLILAAPDVDVDIIRKIESNFAKYKNVTLYSSDSDLAIGASDLVHDNKRAGNSQPPCVFNNVETIDVSEIKRPIFSLGHSYYAETLKIFTDMYYLLRDVPVLQRVNIQHNADLKYYFIK